ncbi:bromodomain-containing protein 140 isoform X2 [Rhodnius prolixus]|uniref:bromodomain-containing protein 140 isoform X2 n=1 Tax=Rhodnius prolixus TaxID=13249 RepID=UPI003D18A7F3
MGLDFDVLEFCRKLRTTKQPPYTCPIVECGKTYKSMCGLQYHLVNFDHTSSKKTDTPAAKPPPTSSKKSRKRGRYHKHLVKETETPTLPKERTSYNDCQKHVEFEIDDDVYRLRIKASLNVISKHTHQLLNPKGTSRMCGNLNMDTIKSKELAKLPEPKVQLLEDYHISNMSTKPIGYIRLIEKNGDEIDGEVEYDMDEEDGCWLDLINKRRQDQGLSKVLVDTFELLMDRLEKESYFQMNVNSRMMEVQNYIDDDAVCCICMDGECQNTNVILFCDMCNLAVHQDCYGVPYIPEGQWLCRRCLQSPSRAVDCVLCPNSGGAFKQTDRGHWAHVVCALWIPEVRFANTVFLEPIDSIETIPPARWKLTCYICKQRGVGACIQCHKTNCYSAFHVTCAQNAGLHMKIDAVKDSHIGTDGEVTPVLVEKLAFCSTHTPSDVEIKPRVTSSPQSLQRKNSKPAPIISIPTIPPDRIQEIGALVTFSKKNQFIQRLIAYWTLKRQLRNGVPLLRRLQSSHIAKRGGAPGEIHQINNMEELRNQLKYWQCLRQDLERARLLCELVRKREKLKRELIKVKAQCLEMELFPLAAFLRRLLDLIRARDTGEIFIEPVDLTEVPDYTNVVKHPMDLSTMRSKIDAFEYDSLAQFQADFELMISNCLAYNSEDTVFYRAALKMRDQARALLKQARIDLELTGLGQYCVSESVPNTSSISVKEPVPVKEKFDSHPSDIDQQLVKLTKDNAQLAPKEMLQKLSELLEQTKRIRQRQARLKRTKLIKTLIAKIKRVWLTSQRDARLVVDKLSRSHQKRPVEETGSDSSTDAEENEETPLSEVKSMKTPTPSKIRRSRSRRRRFREARSESTSEEEKEPLAKRLKLTASPSKGIGSKGDTPEVTSSQGVNRRTSVLFTCKAAGNASIAKSTNTRPSNASMLKRKGRPQRGSSSAQKENSQLDQKTKDSFTIYRTGGTVKSDDDSQSEDGSSCSGCADSTESRCGTGSGSESSDWSEESDHSDDTTDQTTTSLETLDQLQLVWAKCRGYPWYPALIINPKMPRGYIHNGVPIPSPPSDVIALANNYTEPVYLVLFFDTKRTWQWLPRNKLEPLGVNPELDNGKLTESRKPADRKAVRKAFEEAMSHRTQIDKRPETT